MDRGNIKGDGLMSDMPVKLFTTLFGILAFIASPISVTAGDIYILGSLGVGNFDSYKKRQDDFLKKRQVVDLNSTATSYTKAYKMQVGYKVMKNFAIEGGYFDLGHAKHFSNFYLYNQKIFREGQDWMKGWNLSAVGILPLTDRFSLIGKAGASYSITKIYDTAYIKKYIEKGTSSDRLWHGTYGLGTSFDLTQKIAMRFEMEKYYHFKTNSPKIHSAKTVGMMGLIYTF